MITQLHFYIAVDADDDNGFYQPLVVACGRLSKVDLCASVGFIHLDCKQKATSIAIATATETSTPTTATSQRLRRTEISHGGGSRHVCTVDGKY